MKFLGSVQGQIVVAALFLLPTLAMAQDADKQKIIEIEKAFAAHPNAGPEAAAVAKQHLFDGTLIQLTGQGQVGALPKSRVVELNTKPNPSDPNVKSAASVSDLVARRSSRASTIGA